jgi:thiamine pyrophosphate-dependent acetolactate synthase large subunit-like protein
MNKSNGRYHDDGEVIKTLNELTNGDAIITTDVVSIRWLRVDMRV